MYDHVSRLLQIFKLMAEKIVQLKVQLNIIKANDKKNKEEQNRIF